MPGHQIPYPVKMQCMETKLFLSWIKLLLRSHRALDNVLQCTDHPPQVSKTILTSLSHLQIVWEMQ